MRGSDGREQFQLAIQVSGGLESTDAETALCRHRTHVRACGSAIFMPVITLPDGSNKEVAKLQFKEFVGLTLLFKL